MQIQGLLFWHVEFEFFPAQHFVFIYMNMEIKLNEIATVT